MLHCDGWGRNLSDARPWLTVLIPAYNEEACLADSVGQVLARLDSLGVAGEVLIVDDASRDRTAAIADALAAAHPAVVRVCHHPVNQGIGGGFVSGVAGAWGEWMILIPADLALDLAELSKYLDAARTADVVVGVRAGRGDYTHYRMLVSRLNIRAIQLLFGMPLRQFNYISLYRVDLLRRIEIEYWQSAFFFAEVLIKLRDLGARLVEVDIGYVPRASGHATGAATSFILRTAADMLRYRLRWAQRRGRPPARKK
jgi:glycosyltransferase involved in cell wall biosynthesis